MARAKTEPVGMPRACRCAQSVRRLNQRLSLEMPIRGFRGPEFDSPRLHHTFASRTVSTVSIFLGFEKRVGLQRMVRFFHPFFNNISRQKPSPPPAERRNETRTIVRGKPGRGGHRPLLGSRSSYRFEVHAVVATAAVSSSCISIPPQLLIHRWAFAQKGVIMCEEDASQSKQESGLHRRLKSLNPILSAGSIMSFKR